MGVRVGSDNGEGTKTVAQSVSFTVQRSKARDALRAVGATAERRRIYKCLFKTKLKCFTIEVKT